MAVICSSIPDSEREWTQWKGRTARNDNLGQYAVVLSETDRLFKGQHATFLSCEAIEGKPHRYKEGLINKLLGIGDQQTAAKLLKNKPDIDRGVRMNQVCDAYYRKFPRASGDIWPRGDTDKKLRDFLQDKTRHDPAGCRKFCQDVLELNVVFR